MLRNGLPTACLRCCLKLRNFEEKILLGCAAVQSEIGTSFLGGPPMR